MLNILTPYGEHYKITEDGNIIRMDMQGFKPSGRWKFLGLQHVKRNSFIPFGDIDEHLLEDFDPCWKNGRPQWTVRDLDCGTVREWGNTKYHGVKRIWFD